MLPEWLALRLLARISELERRVAGVEFRGRVHSIDADKHLARLKIGKTPEGEDVLSPWLPVSQIAGDLKLHSMPVVGQQVSAVSPSGDIEQASIDRFHWSDGFDPPSKDPDLHVMTFGTVRIELSKQALLITVGSATYRFASTIFQVTNQNIDFHGARMAHNDINVGSSHVHQDVEPGAGLSGTPLPI